MHPFSPEMGLRNVLTFHWLNLEARSYMAVRDPGNCRPPCAQLRMPPLRKKEQRDPRGRGHLILSCTGFSEFDILICKIYSGKTCTYS